MSNISSHSCVVYVQWWMWGPTVQYVLMHQTACCHCYLNEQHRANTTQPKGVASSSAQPLGGAWIDFNFALCKYSTTTFLFPVPTREYFSRNTQIWTSRLCRSGLQTGVQTLKEQTDSERRSLPIGRPHAVKIWSGAGPPHPESQTSLLCPALKDPGPSLVCEREALTCFLWNFSLSWSLLQHLLGN